jgi:hypothetical protein
MMGSKSVRNLILLIATLSFCIVCIGMPQNLKIVDNQNESASDLTQMLDKLSKNTNKHKPATSEMKSDNNPSKCGYEV